MKRSQIMFVFVLAVFGSVFAQSSTAIPHSSDHTAFLNENGTAEVGDDTTLTTNPTTINSLVTTEANVTVDLNVTTAATPDNGTTVEISTVATTSSPPVTTANASVITSSTEGTTAAAFCPALSGFDGASFIGGIVLALGVMVILIIIVKCYNHHSRKNDLQYSQF